MLYERSRRSPNGRIVTLTLLLVCSVLCLSSVTVISLPSRSLAKRHAGTGKLQVVSVPNISARHRPAILHQICRTSPKSCTLKNELVQTFPQLPHTTLANFHCVLRAERCATQFRQAKRKLLTWPLQREFMQLQPSHLHRLHGRKDSHFDDF